VRQQLEPHEERIENCLTRLLLDHRWYGAITRKLTFVAAPKEVCETAQTNGTVCQYNPNTLPR
jgi:hypothetical protein